MKPGLYYASLRELFGAFKTTTTLRTLIHAYKELDATLDEIGTEYAHAERDRSNVLAAAAYRAQRKLNTLHIIIADAYVRIPLDGTIEIHPDGRAATELEAKMRRLEFVPLWQPLPKEAAQTRKANADADAVYLDRDVVEVNKVRQEFGLPPINEKEAFQN